jgi:hypothetical protein
MNTKFKTSFITALLLFMTSVLTAQELNCNVQVISSKIQGTNREVFRELQDQVYEFLNTRIWTEDKFSNEERIECKMLLNIQQRSGDEFKGYIQVSSRRPVFNSSYNSSMINYKDNDLTFRYTQGEPLEFDLATHKDNLSSILAYYAYLIIGLDYDSFSLFGGKEFYQKAQQIVSNAQSSRYKGWKAFEDRKNRYWLVENILNDEYKKVRRFLYEYHRDGLDQMFDEPSKARSEIAQSIELLRDVHREKPDSYLFFLKLMIEAKSDEFVNIYSEGSASEADRVAEMLAEIDPSHSDKYEKITK